MRVKLWLPHIFSTTEHKCMSPDEDLMEPTASHHPRGPGCSLTRKFLVLPGVQQAKLCKLGVIFKN